MAEETPDAQSTLALNTAVENNFVSPLTAVRGALEIIRDFPDLAPDERRRFVDTALAGCDRLEGGIEDLSDAVYAAAEKALARDAAGLSHQDYKRYRERIRILDDLNAVEIDFSDMTFDSADTVNDFFDVIVEVVEPLGRRVYLLVDHTDCRVWPEAWVAYAHRGKEVRVTFSIETVRYENDPDADPRAVPPYEGDVFPSRDAALAHIRAHAG